MEVSVVIKQKIIKGMEFLFNPTPLTDWLLFLLLPTATLLYLL